MTTVDITIQKWGNSFAFRVPRRAFNESRGRVEQAVELFMQSKECFPKEWFGRHPGLLPAFKAERQQARADEAANVDRMDQQLKRLKHH